MGHGPTPDLHPDLAEMAPDDARDRGPGAGPDGELLSIQYLRGLAALLVVAHHALSQLAAPSPRLAFLQGGVDVFFVISGVVMWWTTCRRPAAPAAFVRRRLTRIVPLYWILTSVVVLVLLAAPRLMQTTRFDPAHALASYLFLAWPNPAVGIGVRPLMIPGWTLNYEMFFYGLFALALMLPVRRRLAALAAGFVLIVTAGALLPGLPPAAGFYTRPIILEFVLGLLIAARLQAWRPRSAALPVLLFGVALTALAAGRWTGGEGLSRLVWLGLPAAALVACAAAAERVRAMPRIPLARLAGDASYAIYLSHPLLLSAMAQAWKRSPLEGAPAGLFVAAALPAAVLGGVAVHLWVERPVTRWLQRRFSAAPKPAQPTLAEAAP